MGVSTVEKHSRQTVDELMRAMVEKAQERLPIAVRKSVINIGEVDFALLVDDLVHLVEMKLEKQPSRGERVGIKMLQQMQALDKMGPPTAEWLTKEQAAQYLCMSRGTLNKMLELNKVHLRTREVGNRTQVLTEDVIKYKQDTLRQLDPIKSQMVKEGQEAGLYDLPGKTG